MGNLSSNTTLMDRAIRPTRRAREKKESELAEATEDEEGNREDRKSQPCVIVFQNLVLCNHFEYL
jgi:hypothetical protein